MIDINLLSEHCIQFYLRTNNLILFFFLNKVNKICRTSINLYSKNTKTPRKKLPNETTSTATKWVPNKKV